MKDFNKLITLILLINTLFCQNITFAANIQIARQFLASKSIFDSQDNELQIIERLKELKAKCGILEKKIWTQDEDESIPSEFVEVLDNIGALLEQLPRYSRSWQMYYEYYKFQIETAKLKNIEVTVKIDLAFSSSSPNEVDRNSRSQLNGVYEAESDLLTGNYITLTQMKSALRRKVDSLRKDGHIPSEVTSNQTDFFINELITQIKKGKNQVPDVGVTLYEQYRLMAAFTSQIQESFGNYDPVFFARDAGPLFTIMDAEEKLNGNQGVDGNVYHLNMPIAGDYRNKLSEKVDELEYSNNYPEDGTIKEKKQYVLQQLVEYIDAEEEYFKPFIEERIEEMRRLGIADREKVLWIDTGAIGTMPLIMMAIIEYAKSSVEYDSLVKIKEQDSILLVADEELHETFNPSGMSESERALIDSINSGARNEGFGMEIIRPMELQAKSVEYDDEQETLKWNDWISQMLAYSDKLILYNAVIAKHRGEVGKAFVEDDGKSQTLEAQTSV